jgi:hypothetical protein
VDTGDRPYDQTLGIALRPLEGIHDTVEDQMSMAGLNKHWGRQTITNPEPIMKKTMVTSKTVSFDRYTLGFPLDQQFFSSTENHY